MSRHGFIKAMLYKRPKLYIAPCAINLNKGRRKEEEKPVIANTKNEEGRKKAFFSKTKKKRKEDGFCEVDSITEFPSQIYHIDVSYGHRFNLFIKVII